ncbi:GlxA family transcriptional regulator [Vitreimonas sp.]|jgi:transcriptional regulator GlxA family with amidase domain|uniref:GlxA family transcriptional regulator n=1 Tax=Vitreimonas sp. TaxID=3069702 RepID=UPI002ED80B6A
MHNVTVVLLDDGFASTALMPIEIFHSAGGLWRELRGESPEPRFCVTTVSLNGGPVRSPYAGLMMTPQGALDDVEQSDIVIIPTSGLALDEKLLENSALIPWLLKQYGMGAYLAGVCMGSAYLAEAGLLDGKRATTHWAVAPDLRRRYPRVHWREDMFVTEDSRLLCSGGVTAAADVSLYLVEKLCGHEIAVQTAKALLLTMPRTSQSGYAMLPLSPPHNDDAVRGAEYLLQSKFAENVSVDHLASQVGMSSRTFLRRFKAATGRLPGAYLQAVRVESAKAMLERDRGSVQSIALAVGYEDVSFFRSIFKRATGMTPAEYRTQFAKLNVRNPDALNPGSA